MKNICVSCWLAMFVLLSSCALSQQTFDEMVDDLLEHSVTEVHVEEAADDTTALFLDAREWEEYAVSHIDDAMWIGYDDFDTSRVSNVPRDQKIIVYCSVGYRSEKISEKLVDMGYTNVSNLYGGMFDWANQKQPLVDDKGRPTKNIHPYNDNWGQWVTEGKKRYKPKKK